jgi:hypothetical protein
VWLWNALRYLSQAHIRTLFLETCMYTIFICMKQYRLVWCYHFGSCTMSFTFWVTKLLQPINQVRSCTDQCCFHLHHIRSNWIVTFPGPFLCKQASSLGVRFICRFCPFLYVNSDHLFIYRTQILFYLFLLTLGSLFFNVVLFFWIPLKWYYLVLEYVSAQS